MPPLSKERWAVLGPLLDEALELEEDALTRFLASLRGTSPDVAADLEALLAQDASPLEALLDTTPAVHLRGSGLAGQTVGAYTLDRVIGRGGMATVWLAHRTDGRFEGEVAVKLLNLALLGRAGAARFAQEGTVLARLTHPNIARLLDAGVTDAGQPFLVLERVEGERIDRWADTRGLSPADRIDLCRTVLAAVASAHARLVIHRDIKPSNILVPPDGQVKLLDFGIAKLLLEGRPTADPATLTEEGGRALTPEYAAPELILGEPVSTATDVYSAGVLLYRLLSGVHPTGADARTPAEHIRAVLEVEPRPLSDVVPERWRRFCRGDLDNIVATALKKRPAERYQTATAFADDLARFRSHQPVSARPDSWRYRAGKFLRRHRAAVLAASLVAVTLVGATVFSVRQMQAARRDRDRAADALRRSRATTAFESLLFRLLEPGGEALTYRQLLDKGREVLERQYRGDPVSRMQLGIQFAQNYLREGDGATADTIVTRAVGIADSLGDAHWQARTRCELGIVRGRNRAPDAAVALTREARDFLTGLRGVERGTLNACDVGAADAFIALGQPDSAVPLFQAVADRLATADDPYPEEHLIALNDLVRAQVAAGRIREARAVMLRILAATRDGAIGDPGTVPIFVHNGSRTYDMLGEVRDQRAYLEGEIAAAARLDAAGPHALIAWSYGMVLDRLHQADSAELWLGRALERWQGRDAPRSYTAHLTLARIAGRAGRAGDADRHRQEAAAIEERAVAANLARGWRAADRIEQAAVRGDPAGLPAIVRTELEGLGYAPGATSDALVAPLTAAATALIALGAFADAAPYAAHLVRLGDIDSLTGRQSATVGHGLLLGAEAARGTGDLPLARDLARRALPALAFGLGRDHPLTRRAVALRDSLED